ncbi:MAG: Eco57I restriction-modification methylase domain-containing protein [Candidatus Hermodarchaeota archaeon]
MPGQGEKATRVRRTGTYYTPPDLAFDIASQTLGAFLNSHTGKPLEVDPFLDDLSRNSKKEMLDRLQDIAILDPAVGEGVFLKGAAEWLLRARRLLGDDRPAHRVKSDIVKHNLFGVDIRQDAVSICSETLASWTGVKNTERLRNEIHSKNFKHGNSLVGWAQVPEKCNRADLKCFNEVMLDRLNTLSESTLMQLLPFHWPVEFEEMMGKGLGFDIVLGNPPYGNILSKDEKRIISRTWNIDVSRSQNGTWNAAALFIARAHDLLQPRGHLGFLIPNSVLRTRQFRRVRRFLLDNMPLWMIIDEGSPFEGVTLEMVSIFCNAGQEISGRKIKVESRRPGIDWQGSVPLGILKSSKVFPIYYDALLEGILDRASKGWAKARRGRDLSKSHVSKKRTKKFQVPYATSGRSVRRFHLDSRYLLYADDTYTEDRGLRESYRSNLLVATKNYPFPRCAIKPSGVIHGGGVVEIIPLRDGILLEALGLILNSSIVRYLCIKYLTNYSMLTTCLNTGIMEEIPIIVPKDQTLFKQLFESLQELYQDTDSQAKSDHRIALLELITNALVYEMYLSDSTDLLDVASGVISEISRPIASTKLARALSRPDVAESVRRVMEIELVRQIEDTPRMQQ